MWEKDRVMSKAPMRTEACFMRPKSFHSDLHPVVVEIKVFAIAHQRHRETTKRPHATAHDHEPWVGNISSQYNFRHEAHLFNAVSVFRVHVSKTLGV